MSRRYWEWERPFSWNPESTALLIIDMQRGFVTEGSPLEVPMARAQVPVIGRALEEFRKRGLPVVYTRFVVRPDHYVPFYRTIASQRGLDAVSADAPFSVAGEQAAIVDALAPRADEPVVDKVAYDGFAETSLEGLLRSRGVDTLVMAGTVVNWCVDSTLRSAFHRRFNSIVLADGVSGYDQAGASGEQWVAQELDHFAEAFAVVMTTEELVEALDDPDCRQSGIQGRPARPAPDRPSPDVYADRGGH
jgi:nicotinamidase-related amidase